MRISIVFVLIFFISISYSQVDSAKTDELSKIISPILLDKGALSGLDLSPVTSSSDPERELFQKNLYYGPDISVYVVASETKTTIHENYGLEEFVYVLNGRARLHPQDQHEQLFYTGDFFCSTQGLRRRMGDSGWRAVLL